MFCPDCGMENANSQKFCRRCGVNLVALERAREVITEISTGAPPQIEPRTVLRILAFVASFGFAAVTATIIALSLIQYVDAPPDRWHGPPIGVIAGLFGYTALVLICRQLLNLLKHAPRANAPLTLPPAPARTSLSAPPVDTNRSLSAAPAYHSIVEDETKTFAKQPQSR